MYAYVFWHWSRVGVEASSYEQALRAFHETLQSSSPAGFHGSHVLRKRALPWLPTGDPVFEDWYLIADLSALEQLQQTAISGARRVPHDAAALLAAGGSAGIYRLLRGRAQAPATLRQTWLSKPSGASYVAFVEQVWQLGGASGLWQRQLALGPGPEFCMVSDATTSDGPSRAAPAAWQPVEQMPPVVWHGGS